MDLNQVAACSPAGRHEHIVAMRKGRRNDDVGVGRLAAIGPEEPPALGGDTRCAFNRLHDVLANAADLGHEGRRVAGLVLEVLALPDQLAGLLVERSQRPALTAGYAHDLLAVHKR